MRIKTATLCISASLLLSGCIPGMPNAGFGGMGSYGGFGDYRSNNVSGAYGTTWESMVNGPQASGYGYGYGGARGGYQGPSKEMLGGAGGAALGGLGGAQVGKGNGKLAAVAAGTLLGWLVGSNVGASLDKADLLAAQGGLDRSMESNRPVRWEGPNATGYIEPVRSGRTANGQVCREYQQTVTVGGRPEKAFGQACRQSDGSWRI